jgi:extracellular factor (EF) 3-hydroxypalmitic acid methyl ester biosynthesis protein
MTAQSGEIKDTLVSCITNQGQELRATPVRVARFLAIFEVYNPMLVLRVSEALTEFKIVFQDRVVYSGRAVVRSLVSTNVATICEVVLEENSWMDIEFNVEMLRNGSLREQFAGFIQEWQKLYRVTSEYKLVVADMQSYLAELRSWLDQVELGIRSSPSEDRLQLEEQTTEELSAPVIPCIDLLFERFEAVTKRLQDELLPAHRSYMRRHLHPLVLCSPFAYRTFQKPLGYAGDYEMVNMIVRNGYEGGSLFAKVVNTWFLRQLPATAHRNRIRYLIGVLRREALRRRVQRVPARFLSLACGPAQEVQGFLDEDPLSDSSQITLIDFNEETLQYARTTIDAIKQRRVRQTRLEYVRKSVQQILKESSRTVQHPHRGYDFVYCAGLLDYLSDSICQRLINIMYDWLAPEGLLVVTNVEPSNPLRNGMEHLLDWHLIYRTARDMHRLTPSTAPADASCVRSDDTGVNVFLEVRKVGHG